MDRHRGRGVAVRVKFESSESEVYTFDQLSRLSSKFANLLKGAGVERGGAVALALEPSLEFYASLFGALKAGARVVICSPLLGPEAVRYRLERSQARLLVAAEAVQGPASASPPAPRTIWKDEFLDLVEGESETAPYDTSVNDVAVVQFTSGTTGPPKPILYRHKSLVNLAPVARFAYGVKAGDSFFCPSQAAWGHGLWGGTLGPLAFGVPTGTVSGRFSPERLLEALEEFRVNNLTISPTALRKLLSTRGVERFRLRLQKLTYTGEALDLDSFRRAEEELGATPHSLYGSTEVGVAIANFAGFRDWRVKPGSLGKPMLGVEAAVLGEDGAPLPPGRVGEIAVRLREGWVRMGDLGLLDEEGYFWFRGRADDVIKSSGYRIGPEEVEAAINSHPAVLESAAVGFPDPLRGEAVKAFVRLKPGFSPSEGLRREIQIHVRERLAKYAYPRLVEFVGDLPKTPDGKIKRKELRNRQGRGFPG